MRIMGVMEKSISDARVKPASGNQTNGSARFAGTRSAATHGAGETAAGKSPFAYLRHGAGG
jgi:hypothetical protein